VTEAEAEVRGSQSLAFFKFNDAVALYKPCFRHVASLLSRKDPGQTFGRGGNCDILQHFRLFSAEALQFSSFLPNLMTPSIQEDVTAVLPGKGETGVGLNPLALPCFGSPRPLRWQWRVLLYSDVIAMSWLKASFPDDCLIEKLGKENGEVLRKYHLDSN